MMMILAMLQASSTSPAAIFVQVLPILAVIAIWYFVVIAPASKQRRQTAQMLSSLKKGDRVLTSGGIYGTIQSVEPDSVQLRIAENVKVKVTRSSVASVVNEPASE